MPEYITDNKEVSYDDSDIEDFDEEISNEDDSDEKIVMKQIKYRMYLFLYLKHFERLWVIHMLKKDFHKRLVKRTKMFLKKKE